MGLLGISTRDIHPYYERLQGAVSIQSGRDSSNWREIVHGLFDTSVGDIRVDPIRTIHVRNDPYLRA